MAPVISFDVAKGKSQVHAFLRRKRHKMACGVTIITLAAESVPLLPDSFAMIKPPTYIVVLMISLSTSEYRFISITLKTFLS